MVYESLYVTVGCPSVCSICRPLHAAAGAGESAAADPADWRYNTQQQTRAVSHCQLTYEAEQKLVRRQLLNKDMHTTCLQHCDCLCPVFGAL